jgi:hypothetical protein
MGFKYRIRTELINKKLNQWRQLQKNVFKNGRDANSVLLSKTTAAGKHNNTLTESRALNVNNSEK